MSKCIITYLFLIFKGLFSLLRKSDFKNLLKTMEKSGLTFQFMANIYICILFFYNNVNDSGNNNNLICIIKILKLYVSH